MIALSLLNFKHLFFFRKCEISKVNNYICLNKNKIKIINYENNK